MSPLKPERLVGRREVLGDGDHSWAGEVDAVVAEEDPVSVDLVGVADVVVVLRRRRLDAATHLGVDSAGHELRHLGGVDRRGPMVSRSTSDTPVTAVPVVTEP